MTHHVAQSDRTGKWILFSTILASSMAFIDGSALNVALPALQDDLNATGVQLLWIVDAYLLLLASLLLLGGSLGDHFGRKRIFRAGILLFSLASLACGLAPNPALLIAARAVQGIGGALMVPGSLAIISALFDSSDRGKAIGIWSAASTITTIGGPILGGLLASGGLWRFVFFINLPLAALALYGLRHVPENKDENASKQIDYPGALLAAVGLAGLTYGFIQLGEHGVQNGIQEPVVILALVIGVLTLIAFGWVERHSSHPMIDLSLFRSRPFSGTNAMTAFLYAALAGVFFFLPLNLIQIQGYNEAVAGFTMTPFALLLAGLSPWAGGLVDRYGPRLLLTVGPAIVGVGFMLLALPGITDGPRDFWTTYLPGILGTGIGMGITVAPLTSTVMGAAPEGKSGTASGINNAVARLAGVLAIAVMGAIALGVFSAALTREAEAINLSGSEREALHDQAGELGNAEAPDSIAADQRPAVENAIQRAFVSTFRVLAVIGAALAWISAFVAGMLLQSKPRARSNPSS
ncbi:MAG TPA: MFS transporter [Aggregatilineaceae bacterium]|nr:MFS transporter [Aggregatilineaceae bacterium]